MKTSDFKFDLPDALIAQVPLKNRTDSKLMMLDKNTGSIEHNQFRDLLSYLNAGDVLVFNNSKVIPARVYGKRADSDAIVEILLLTQLNEKEWECLVKPGKRAKVGHKIIFGQGELIGEITKVLDNGNRIISFEFEGLFIEILESIGEMPLPPYITEKLNDKDRYQTVYALHNGSAAAPTAGLHFTPEFMAEIEAKGIIIAYVTLHVGLGTFRPVKVENVENHEMHAEFYTISQENCDKINCALEEGRRVVAVGTTSLRALESSAVEARKIQSLNGWTKIFIYPGYAFKVVDALVTNFHLPESTLLMLISALATKEIVMNAYEQAILEKYRFFSFGDAMFIY